MGYPPIIQKNDHGLVARATSLFELLRTTGVPPVSKSQAQPDRPDTTHPNLISIFEFHSLSSSAFSASQRSSIMPPTLPSHSLKIVLISPQIAPNTGNIARLCVATGTELHLVRPLGFVLSDKQLRRSAMDYWPRLKLTVHDDLPSFLKSLGDAEPWLITSRGQVGLWETPFRDGDYLIFGNESAGLPEELHTRWPDRRVRIPQAANERCLNLSTAAGIALYEAIRKTILK